MTVSHRFASIVTAIVLLAAACPATGNRGRYNKMFAVPTPGPITIDGDLSDWDRSAEIEFFVVPETRASQTTFFSVMYDSEAIYLGGTVRDNSPMMNRHDPDANGHKGWDADAFQFRLVTDASATYPLKENQFRYGALRHPDGKLFSKAEREAADKRNDVVHLILWHYTDKATPALQMHYGFTYRVPRPEWVPHGVVPNDLYQAKYKKQDDGLGYTFEYRIPWSTLGAKRPLKGGDIVAATVQTNWSRPDGLKSAGGAAWAYDVLANPGFPFQSGETWGKLIFRDEGDVPREQVDAGLPPEKPLPLEFEYEVPTDGEVTVQLVDKNNFVVRTLVAQGKRNGGVNVEKWDGLDSSGAPLAAGAYQWIGNHTDQQIRLKYRFSVHNSGKPAYPTPDNKGGWGGDHGIPTAVTAIPGSKDLMLGWNYCEFGWGIIRVTEDGKKKWGSKHNATHLASDGKRLFAIDQHGFHGANGVKVFDASDSRPLSFQGKAYAGLEPTGDKDKDHLTGLAYHDGKLYVAYEHRNTVAVFDANNAKKLGTYNVPHARYPAVNADGVVYVVSNDTTMTLAPGAETFTPFAGTNLDNPQGIAIASDGHVHVANRGKLMNISVFNASGKFIKSIGRDGGRNAVGAYQPDGVYKPSGMSFDSQGRLWVAEYADSPKRHSVWNVQSGQNVNEFFGGSSYFGYCVIDPARPDEIYGHNTLWKIDWDNYTTKPVSTIWRKFEPNAMLSFIPDGYQGLMRVFTHKNGKQFAYGGAYNAYVLAMRKGDIFQPIMATFNIRRGQYGYGNEQFQILKDEKRYPNGQYFWQDANDDGIVQHEEITRFTEHRFNPQLREFDRNTLDAWTAYGWTFKPTRFEDGRPIYDPKKREKNILYGTPHNRYITLDPDGSVFVLTAGQAPSWAKFSKTGELLIGYPNIVNWRRSLGFPVIKPGRLWGMTGPLGVGGDFTGNATYFGMSHLFDRNGHYVAGLGYDGRVGGDPSIAGQPEGQGGALVKLNIKGKQRYFLLQGGQDGRVMEIMNLATIKPLAGGTYVLSEKDAATAAESLADYKEAIARAGGLSIVRSRSALDSARTVGKDLEGGRSFKAALAYDQTNLYAKFVIKADAQLVNAQPDPKLIFKGGNLLDIQLATDPEAPANRDKPAVGDVRLLVSKDPAGQTKALLYQPLVKGFKGDRIVLKSPTGEEPFDKITDVSSRIELQARRNREGFTAYVTIPLDLIGFAPSPGQTIKADLGYIFGNKQGTRTMVRAYWVNNGFSANVVDDIPNESRLTPAEWGNATVE